jgi:GNAT superfamily N-acetyltransferase
MWEAIADLSDKDLDAADVVYRRWARPRIRSGRMIGLIVDVDGHPVASGCVWLMEVQPRPTWTGTTAAYLMSMYTEPGHRGKGHATRIVRAAVRWAKSRDVPNMVLHASPFGESIYRRLGFRQTKEMRKSLTRGPRRRTRDSKPPRRRRSS